MWLHLLPLIIAANTSPRIRRNQRFAAHHGQSRLAELGLPHRGAELLLSAGHPACVHRGTHLTGIHQRSRTVPASGAKNQGTQYLPLILLAH